MRKIITKWYFWLVLIGVIGAIIAVFTVYNNSRPVDITKYMDVKATGFNHHGSAKITGSYKKEINKILDKRAPDKFDKYSSDIDVSLDKNGDLSNGDTVKIIVKTSEDGNPIKSAEKSIKIKGLNQYPKIKNMNDVLKNVDKRVRSNFMGNSVYKWKFERDKDVVMVPGTIVNTNTYEKAESKKSTVDDNSFSIIVRYHFDGKGDMTKDEHGYVLAGYSNIKMNDSKINIASIPDGKTYWHLGDGTETMTLGFLDWINTFSSKQEVDDWIGTKYPNAIHLQYK